MDSTQRGSPEGESQQAGASPFRRYGWVLAAMAFVLILLCVGIGVMEAGGGQYSILAHLRGGLSLDSSAPTLIPAQDQPTRTASPTKTPLPSETPTASDTPTSTAAPTVAVTCRCSGANYVCSNGAVTNNSSKCAPVATPSCACQKHDWVCSDGTRSVNDLRCGVVCGCNGNDLYCNDGTVGIYNPQCACTCQGTTMICNDGGSLANAAFCGGKRK
jgi:hypothetical protein